MTFCMKVWCTC